MVDDQIHDRGLPGRDRQITGGNGDTLHLVLAHVLARIEAQADPAKIAIPRCGGAGGGHHLEDLGRLVGCAVDTRRAQQRNVVGAV